jgi:hypothetical protein
VTFCICAVTFRLRRWPGAKSAIGSWSPAVTDYTAEDGEGAQGSYQRPLPRPLHPCAPVQIPVARPASGREIREKWDWNLEYGHAVVDVICVPAAHRRI